MGIFSKKSVITPEKWGSKYFYPLTMLQDIFGDESNYLNDFLQVPEVNAVINIRAKALASWKLELVSKTTGKPQTNNESLARIIRNPNWFQAQGEFWRQSSIFHDIYGNEFLYFLKPVGMPNTFKGLFTLDPSKVEIKYTKKSLFFLESTNEGLEYWYDSGSGSKIKLEKENIIHFNDNRVSGTDFIKGQSKLAALQVSIKNIRVAYEKRNIALNMPIGVLSNGQSDAISQTIPMNPTEKAEAEQQLKTRGAFPIITNLAVKYDNMTINSSQLGLFEEVREDTGRICDLFGVPYELLANQKGTTFTNLKEAKKQFYEETIIPEAEERLDGLNMYLDTMGKSWEVKGSYDHLPVFSDNQKERAISLKQMIEALSKALMDEAITIDQYKNELQKYGI